jgi:Ras-related protein Rab-5C
MDAERVRNLVDNATAKIILLGDVGAGKTSILHQYQLRSFRDNIEATVGIATNSIAVRTSFGLQQIQIWDTAGQERYRSLVPMYARSASAALIVIDTNSPDSATAAEHWVTFVHQNCPSQCLAFLVANKIDLPRLINWDRFVTLAKENGLPIIQATATQYHSVAGLFVEVAEEIAKNAQKLPSMDVFANLSIQLPNAEKEKCC